MCVDKMCCRPSGPLISLPPTQVLNTSNAVGCVEDLEKASCKAYIQSGHGVNTRNVHETCCKMTTTTRVTSII